MKFHRKKQVDFFAEAVKCQVKKEFQKSLKKLLTDAKAYDKI